MKTHKLQPILTLTILAVLVLTLLPTNSVFAATCTGSGCKIVQVFFCKFGQVLPTVC